MIERRRFLAITGAALLAPMAARAQMAVRWRGRALGAEAEIVLEHADGAQARAALADALTELERLEAVFSLYRSDSALARLNTAGRLEPPPLDLVRVLSEAAAISQASAGAFDVTMQPLWALHAGGRLPADPSTAKALVNWQAMEVSPERIAFHRPGMAASLNGIAQGYITDRVAELLRRRGFANVLVDLGETRALGPHADGRPWSVVIRDPARREASLRQLSLSNGAIATTEALGSSFATGVLGHLIDPASGQAALDVPSVTIRAPNATLADGLSTALAVAGPGKAKTILSRFPGTKALFALPSGELIEI